MEDYFSLQTPVGITIYGVLVFLFVFLYSYIQTNPEQIAKNFEKSHKFIPGIRSGVETERYISRVLTRINFFGAPYLAIIAVIPYVFASLLAVPSSIGLGGTGIVIVVSVALELWRAINSIYTTTNYQLVYKNMMIAHQDVTAKESSQQDEGKETINQLW